MEIKNLRPTWVEIDLDAIEENIRSVKSRINEGVNIMAVVKANAYGHGIIEIAKIALKVGCKCLGVATVTEGIQLRREGIKAPILILGTLYFNQVDDVLKYDLTPTIYSYDLAEYLSGFGQKVKVHIKLDTGMGRIGLLPDQALKEIRRIAQLPNLEIEGAFTHFSMADTNEDYTMEQLEKFNRVISSLKSEGIEIPILHTANSGAIINFPQTHYNLVRMGIIMYGLYPDKPLRRKIKLKSALKWKAKIVYLKEVEEDTKISYGGRYTTKKKTRIGTLPVGYHDGYSRALSGITEVLFKGQRVPVIGNICMDQMMIDLSGTEAEVGDEVTLIGEDVGDNIEASELAEKLNTINYEIISRISPRVPRVFYRGKEIIDIREE
ncbi:alanine racemase [Halonatronum saccharophilum]|uniref:alanine racemase n=1 Tax=Halonatronum saccharophilum TaxID=150060 RepID=UPI00054EF452|nr:alanine racemase [Halonatronum saccharophilum]